MQHYFFVDVWRASFHRARIVPDFVMTTLRVFVLGDDKGTIKQITACTRDKKILFSWHSFIGSVQPMTNSLALSLTLPNRPPRLKAKLPHGNGRLEGESHTCSCRPKWACCDEGPNEKGLTALHKVVGRRPQGGLKREKAVPRDSVLFGLSWITLARSRALSFFGRLGALNPKCPSPSASESFSRRFRFSLGDAIRSQKFEWSESVTKFVSLFKNLNRKEANLK